MEAARTHSPRIRMAQQRLEAARGRAVQAGLFPNPMAEVEYKDVPVSPFESGDGIVEGMISQPFPIGGRLAGAREAARAEVAYFEAELAATVRQVEGEVHMAWCDLLFFRDAAALTQDLLAVADDLGRIAQERHTAGSIRAFELERAQLLSETLANDVVKYTSEMVYTSQRLERMIGGIAVPTGTVQGRLYPGMLYSLFDFSGLDVVEGHPELRAAQARVEWSAASTQTARREAVPDLNVRLGGGYSNRMDEGFASAGLSMALPVFNRNQGKISEMDSLRAEAGSGVTEVRLRLLNLRDDSLQRINEFDTLAQESARVLVPRSRAAFESAREAFQAGDASFLDVLNAVEFAFRMEREALEYRGQLNSAMAVLATLRGDIDLHHMGGES